ncbi:hypothetical protein HGRIS_010377 [Hohenbuehelia grisea]|uniref:Uncharacterized protein n=1 Tax=Hohenbuehelia grisea TaxID=104357 RepID=A0ABR3J462_9AGAR
MRRRGTVACPCTLQLTPMHSCNIAKVPLRMARTHMSKSLTQAPVSFMARSELHSSAARARPLSTEQDFDKQEVGFIEKNEQQKAMQKEEGSKGREPGETTINLDKKARVMREKTLKPAQETEEKQNAK